MAAFTSEEIIQATGARLLKPAASVSFSDVCTDTRVIAKGSLFVAFKGTSFNGHDFVDKALAAGAAGAVVSEVRPEYEGLTAPIFVAADTLKAYQDLARFHRRRFAIPVVAVTGSVGKTSTRNMIAAVLSEKYKVLQTEKNYNNEIGLPKTLLQLTADHEACVVEMGMRGLGQIAELVDIGEPTIGVVTNVGKSHIELLGSQENIAKAKSELVQGLDAKGTAILNGDDPFVAPMKDLCQGRSVLYGTDDSAQIRAENIVCDEKGVRFTCRCFDRTFDVSVPVIGRHNVYNALAAIASGYLTGLSDAELQSGLSAYRGMAMRQELLHLGPYTFINDTYNANPASMAEAIRTLDLLTRGRKIAVLGGMGELGDWAEREHRAIGRLVADMKLDALITMGNLAEDIARAAQDAGMKAVYMTDSHEAAARQLKALLRDGDTVLLKGSRSFAMEKILPYFERK